jgi:hypothetical protein
MEVVMSGMDRQAMLNLYKREKDPRVDEFNDTISTHFEIDNFTFLESYL